MPKMTTGTIYVNRKGNEWRVVDVDHEGDFPVTARAVDGDGVIRCTHTGKTVLQGTDALDLVAKAEAPAPKAKTKKKKGKR